MQLFAYLGLIYLFTVAWPLAITDIRERRLPNRLVLPAIPITVAGQVLASIGGATWWQMLIAAIAALITFGLGLLANLRSGLGMGDVKLMTTISLALGWFSPMAPFVALSLAFVAAGLWLGLKLLVQKANMGSSVALGPYLLVGFAAAAIGQVMS
ncbi:MAG: hypothetical protein RL174_796 [Actinomycetota bacterium]|jgi:leader peptidase (prepilin peptidase)/N-methyltransferase